MEKLNFKFAHPEFSDDKLNDSVLRILSSNILSSIATIKDNESYIHTAYYCFNSKLDFYFISDPATQHTKNIEDNSSVALAIYDSKQVWDNNKCGLQIFGNCEIAKGTKLIEGTMLYLKRFAGLKQWIQHPDDFIKGAINSKMFVINTSKITLFDEDAFGEEVFINLIIK
ncbi:MAG: pyridoxamine 5'-phosphate oxidase family protein [Candidatus Kapabacteria bacterium]|nr:pyridoxamine 5'-phosphate oxidase family protein [Candidatus Kapabacteria bacterium]